MYNILLNGWMQLFYNIFGIFLCPVFERSVLCAVHVRLHDFLDNEAAQVREWLVGMSVTFESQQRDSKCRTRRMKPLVLCSVNSGDDVIPGMYHV